MECFECGETGHFKGSAACKDNSGGTSNPAKKKKKKGKDKVWKLEEEKEEASDTDSLGRVEEVVRAAESSKSKTADVDMTIPTTASRPGRVPSPS